MEGERLEEPKVYVRLMSVPMVSPSRVQVYDVGSVPSGMMEVPTNSIGTPEQTGVYVKFGYGISFMLMLNELSFLQVLFDVTIVIMSCCPVVWNLYENSWVEMVSLLSMTHWYDSMPCSDCALPIKCVESRKQRLSTE